ncbi:MAG TPA: hypothetical protein VF988_06095, partial [Verrucomicrobiae bacterium]
MNEDRLTHITDDLGNDVVNPCRDREFDALCAVADAAEQDHREHCLLLTSNCRLCQALAELDRVR